MPGRGDIRAGRAFVELALRDQAFRKGLGGMLGLLKRAAIAGGALFAGLSPAIALRTFLQTGDALDKMRQRTGLSVEALSELSHAADQSGTSLAVVEKAVRKMQKEIGGAGKPTKEVEETLRALGLSVSKLKGLKPEDQFQKIADAIAAVEDPTKRAALAQDIFGRSGTELLPMIESLAALRKEAREMGFVMSDIAAANAVRLGDKLSNLWKTVKFGAIAIGEALSPAIESLVDKMQPAATETLKWMQSIRDAIIGGNLSLGADIAMAGVKLAFLKGWKAVKPVWGLGLGLLEKGWDATLGTLLGSWNDFWFDVKARIIDATAEIRKLLARLEAHRQRAIGIASQGFLGAGPAMEMQRLQSIIARPGSGEEERKRARERLKELQKERDEASRILEDTTERKVARAEKEKETALKGIDEERKRAQEENERRRRLGPGGRAQEDDAKLDAAIAAAEAVLKALQDQANRSSGNLPWPFAAPVGLMAALQNFSRQEEAKARQAGKDAARGGQALAEPGGAQKAVFGTFSAAALAAVGGGGIPQRQLQTLKEIRLAARRQNEIAVRMQHLLERLGKVK